MATRETQAKITSAALELFNQFGSASVSFDKIASKAGISKGNLALPFFVERTNCNGALVAAR